MDIRLENLSIGYKGHAVASDINIAFQTGKLTCLIGENGSGKSTLLKTISGYIPATSGNVMLGEKDVRLMTHNELARTVSIVLTSMPDAGNLTATEMVAMGRTPYTGFFGNLHAADRQIVANSLADTGVTDLADRLTCSLSDGERQKVMIARALAQQTPVMLLDEPTAFLDYPSKAELMRLLARLAHNDGKTVVVSTHDLGIAVHIADDFYLLSDGAISQVSREKASKYVEKLIN